MAALRSHPLRTRLLLGALLLAAVLLLVAAPVFVLAMAPAVALFALVAIRVMPGEDLIVRLRWHAPPRRRAAVAAAQRPYDASCRAPHRPPDRGRRSPCARRPRRPLVTTLDGARIAATRPGRAPVLPSITRRNERVRAPNHRSTPRHRRRVALAAVACATPAVAAPAPCGGVPQIADAVGDGHHETPTSPPPGCPRRPAACRP